DIWGAQVQVQTTGGRGVEDLRMALGRLDGQVEVANEAGGVFDGFTHALGTLDDEGTGASPACSGAQDTDLTDTVGVGVGHRRHDAHCSLLAASAVVARAIAERPEEVPGEVGVIGVAEPSRDPGDGLRAFAQMSSSLLESVAANHLKRTEAEEVLGEALHRA